MSAAGGGAGESSNAAAAPVPFYKLTGSGNDFVFFDERAPAARIALAAYRTPAMIEAVCDRRNGVGADGVVFVERVVGREVRIAYYNRDGSRAALCGNATLCTARLAAELGAVGEPSSGFVVVTDAGRLAARVPGVGDPVIEIGPVLDVAVSAPDVALQAGERAVGYALAGVPHLVVLVDDVRTVELTARGAALRAPTRERPNGANVNWVSGAGARWRMRTFERGVEGETLACGTGAVAAATVIARWTGERAVITLVTGSGRPVDVVPAEHDGGVATLAGEGRLVYAGTLTTLA